MALVLAGCASAPPPAPPETDAEARARLERSIQSGSDDPWTYYELGVLDEKGGDLEAAVDDYGAAVTRLPPRKVTRPALALGRVHLRRGNDAAARRMFEEVLATTPAEPRYLRENPDYREAALGLREVFTRAPDAALVRNVRERFLGELGGKPTEWPEEP